MNSGDYPAIKYSEIFQNRTNIKECINRVNPEIIKSPKYCKYGDLLIVKVSENEWGIGKAIVYLGNENPIIGQEIISFRHNENPKFLLYLMSCEFVKKQIKDLIVPSTVFHLYEKHIRKVKISLPPRHIQDLITESLDKWTEIEEQLEKELSRELDQRKKQYEYYKDSLLNNGINKWNIVSLDKVATEIIDGNEVKKVQLGTGDYPAIRYAEIFQNQLYIEECTSKVNLEIIKSPRYCQYGDLLISKFSENIQETGKSVVYLGSSKPMIGQHIIAIRHKENPKFLQYLMSCEFVKKQIQSLAISSTVFCLYSKHIKKIKIPLPPRYIQDQIAEYLDKWTSLERQLEQELEQELEQRKKQYYYYKESLLNGGMNNWEIVSLDKIATEIIEGKEVKKDQLETGDYPAIRYAEIFKNQLFIEECTSRVNPEIIKSPRYCQYGDLLISRVSENSQDAGKPVVYLGKETPIIGQAVHAIRHKENPKFLSYILSSTFVKDQFSAITKGVTIINVTKSCFQHIKVPLPSLEEQEQIVEVLDKFHTIAESFKDGLPSLIEKHRKQYIYYKEQILNPEITL